MADMSGMATEPSPIVFFLPVWIGMMVAMMFPSIVSMVMLFTAVSRNRREASRPTAPTWVFLSEYLAIWSLFGIGAYLLSLVVPAVRMTAPGLRADSPFFGGSF
jgi:predicted metal-binding membrane protein